MSRLRFNPTDHSYWLGEQRIPGVTAVIASQLPAEVVSKREAFIAAGLRGTRVHFATELIDLGMEADEEGIEPYCDAYRLFRSQVAYEVIAQEERVYHPRHQYAGTIDRVALIDGRRGVLDIKTAARFSPTWGLQLAAYAAALPSTSTLRRWVLQLKANGQYELHQFTRPDDYAAFLAALTLHRWHERTNNQ